MYYIYKLTKPTDNGIYIGRTRQELLHRLYQHRAQSKKLNLKVYNWFDNSCQIELIEITDNKEREIEIIKQYVENPDYEVMNTYVGQMDQQEYGRLYYREHAEYIRDNISPKRREKRNEYQKTSPHAKQYRQQYYKFYFKAKKEGLTVNEYKTKYNII